MTSRLLVDKIEGKTTAGTVAMPAGHVVQVQYSTNDASYASTTANHAAAFAATNLDVNITPKFSNSIIKIDCLLPFWFHSGLGAEDYFMCTIYRDSTNIGSGTGGRVALFRSGYADSGNAYNLNETVTFYTFDTPNTTSQITYKLYVKTYNGSEVRFIDAGQENTIVATEIAQ